MRALAYHFAAALVLAFLGCDTVDPSSFEREIVVEAYLVAGESLDDVRLTYTVPIEDEYDPDSLGVTGADVRIELLSEEGEVEESYPYLALPVAGGRYVLDTQKLDLEGRDTDPPVLPLRSYRLVVRPPESDLTITSVTTVPDTFQVVHASSDSVVYRSDEPLIMQVSSSTYPGRQNIFVLTTTALEPSVSGLTPFAEAVYENGDVTIAELSENASPPLNEENFDRQSDGSLQAQYPWLGVSFFGRNRVTLRTLDDNLYDFIRSQGVQQGGSTLPPGEIPNVLEHVNGARGIFGSVAEESLEFVVLRDAGDA